MSSGERTPHASTAEDPSESVVRDAIDWLVRLKSSHATAEDRTAFEVWRRADPAHDAAWDRLQAMERDVGSLSSEQRTLVRSTLDSARRQQRRRQALKLIAIGGLVAGSGLAATSARDLRHDHATGYGERERIALPNGGEVILNTRSAVDLPREASGALYLSEGEIHVATGSENGPAVETRHAVFASQGTRFTLRYLGEATRLFVLDGAVRIAPHGRVVEANEMLRVSASGVAPDPLAKTMDPVAWLGGRLIVRGMRLDAFLEELWRYRGGWLHVDPAVAGLEVSGVFLTQDTAAALLVLQRTLPVRIDSYTGLVTRVLRGA